MTRRSRTESAWAFCIASSLVVQCGCAAFFAPREPYPAPPPDPSPASTAPRELDMVTMPPYVIEPPDILSINAIKVVPKPPHILEPFDGILIRALGVLPDQPIADAFFIDPEGKVDLGPSYGQVQVANMTTDEAQAALQKHLAQLFEDPVVTVSLAYSAGAQQITGEHLVAMDGRVNLGTYGEVYVAGMTKAEARTAIEEQLSQFLEKPQVVVDVFAYNSKKYYVVTQGAGFGDNVTEAPITGKETVLDAISRIGGISQLSSTRIWIARPAPNGVGCEQTLPVDWEAITKGGSTATNYQLLPGDRLFIAQDPFITFGSLVTKYTRPFETLFGFVSLGTAMANRITRYGLGQF